MKHNFDQALNGLFKNTVGFDKLLDMLDEGFRDINAATYPPYNIIKRNGSFRVEIAVAGFSREDINVELIDDRLIVTGEDRREEAADEEVLHRGIALRKFERVFKLADSVELKSATLKDGLLVIQLNEKQTAPVKTKIDIL